MFSALFSFLGGSIFRSIWGEFSHWLTEQQAQNHEIERMRLQADIDAAQHQRQLESIKVQAELGIKIVQVQAEATVENLEVVAWSKLVEGTTKLTGIGFIDMWNQSIRPLLATLAIGVVVFEIVTKGFILSDWDRELVGAILGIYVADRSLSRRGK